MSSSRQILNRITRASLAAPQFTATHARWISSGPYGSLTGKSTTDPAAGASVKPSTKGVESPKSHEQNGSEKKTEQTDKPVQGSDSHKKTQAERDAETLSKLQGRDGDGGAAGIEYEDGKPVSMKRSVKNNMFRYI